MSDGTDLEIATAVDFHTSKFEEWIRVERRREESEERRGATSFA